MLVWFLVEIAIPIVFLMLYFLVRGMLVRVVNDRPECRGNLLLSTVRGADLLFVGYARLPKGEAPENLTIPPDLVVEVRSPSDRLNAVIAKATEYIDAGVRVVVVLDPKTESAAVHRLDEFAQVFHNGDELTLPDVLPGFSVPVKKFFE